MKGIFTNKFKWLTLTVAVILLAIMVVALGLAFGKINTTTKLGNFGYKIGNVDTSTGKVIESNQHLYSKMLNCKDMAIEVKDNATATYDVIFYDADGELLQVYQNQSSDFDTSYIPQSAKTFRVVITPALKDGEPVTILKILQHKYTSQFVVTYTK